MRDRVALLTNPSFPSGADKNTFYLVHVRQAVHADPWVAAIKLADFSTNAWRLSSVADPKRRAKLHDKDRPVLAMFRELVRDAPAVHPLAEKRVWLDREMTEVWARDYV